MFLNSKKSLNRKTLADTLADTLDIIPCKIAIIEYMIQKTSNVKFKTQTTKMQNSCDHVESHA